MLRLRQSNETLVLAPWASVAWTVTWYRPSPSGPPVEALAARVPVISPVVASIARPGGRPLAA